MGNTETLSSVFEAHFFYRTLHWITLEYKDKKNIPCLLSTYSRTEAHPLEALENKHKAIQAKLQFGYHNIGIKGMKTEGVNRLWEVETCICMCIHAESEEYFKNHLVNLLIWSQFVTDQSRHFEPKQRLGHSSILLKLIMTSCSFTLGIFSSEHCCIPSSRTVSETW